MDPVDRAPITHSFAKARAVQKNAEQLAANGQSDRLTLV